MPKRISRAFVRPLTSSLFVGECEPLSGLDEVSSTLYIPVGLCFNTLLCPEKLKAALSKTLDIFPEYSGRLHGGRIEKFSSGALFEISIRSEADARSYTSSNDWQRVDAIFSVKRFSRPSRKDPLLHVRLSLFPSSELSILFVVTNHALGDAHSMEQFMHIWSFHCGGHWPAKTPLLTHECGHRRIFRYTKDKAPKNIAELWAKDPTHLTSPIDRVASMTLLPHIIWSVLRHRVMEIRIDAAGVKEWKTRVTDALPSGAWVSSFELIFSMLYFAKSIADGTGVHNEEEVYPVINLRSRLSNPRPKYHGNLSLADRLMLGASDQVASSPDSNTTSIANIAAQFHNNLRNLLGTGDKLAEPLKWTNAVQDLDYGSRLNCTSFGDFIAGDAVLMNSWYHYRWLDIDMGSGERATKFISPSACLVNLWTLMPRDRHSGDLTIHLAMEKAQAKVFLRTIAKLDMPFHLVEHFVR